MKKSIVLTGSIFIGLSIILGAIAAHSLEQIVTDQLILTFEKGVKYLMYSGLGLLILGLNHQEFKFNLKIVYRFIIWGTILFSGNIFIYIFNDYLPSLKHFVHIVPIGGLCMIIGWGVLVGKLIKY